MDVFWDAAVPRAAETNPVRPRLVANAIWPEMFSAVLLHGGDDCGEAGRGGLGDVVGRRLDHHSDE